MPPSPVKYPLSASTAPDLAYATTNSPTISPSSPIPPKPGNSLCASKSAEREPRSPNDTNTDVTQTIALDTADSKVT
jgi:hypothetical protein